MLLKDLSESRCCYRRQMDRPEFCYGFIGLIVKLPSIGLLLTLWIRVFSDARLLNENFVKNSKEVKKLATPIVRDCSRHDFANLMDDGP